MVKYKVCDKVMFRLHGKDVWPHNFQSAHPLKPYHGKLCTVTALGAASRTGIGIPTYFISAEGLGQCEVVVYQEELSPPVAVELVYTLKKYRYEGPGDPLYTVAVMYGENKLYSTLGYTDEWEALSHAAGWLQRWLDKARG